MHSIVEALSYCPSIPPNGIEASAHASASSNGGASGASLPLWLAPVRCIQTLVSIPYPSPCDWLWWVCSPKYTNPCLDILSMAWWWNWQDETKQQSLCLCDGHHWICSVCSTEKWQNPKLWWGCLPPSPRRPCFVETALKSLFQTHHVTWILFFNLSYCNFIPKILFQTALLSGRMATGNPTTEAQQAYDNFWPKVTDGKWISRDFFSPSASPRNKKYVHCGPQASRTATGQDKEDNEAGWGCESE